MVMRDGDSVVAVGGRVPGLSEVIRGASGDGVGDLRGLARHLDDLAWLGVDAIWLSPFFLSPMADYGYDVADYREVDPLFGTLGDLDRLVTEPTTGDAPPARLGAQPHVRPTPVVPREPVVDGQPPARLVRLARPGTGRRAAQQLDRRVHGRPAWTSTRPPASTTCTASSPSNPI